MRERVLLLSPSRGRGGGIERYVETLEWALSVQEIDYARVDLDRSGISAHARMLVAIRQEVAAAARPTRLIVAHRALLPTARLAARDASVRGISVVCHGGEVWGPRFRPRRYIESRLMRGPAVRIVAASSFTAGVVSATSPAVVLRPGLSRAWFDLLIATSAAVRPASPGADIVTAFRLAEWRSKGLPELLAAVAALGRADIRVTVCGSGDPPPELLRLVHQHAPCTLLVSPTDRDLAGRLAAADIFVLATRTRRGRHACGEGFGLVLLEAQVAGTPVIAPAYGGSRDAYVDGVTGLSPIDESAGELSRVLGHLLRDRERLALMGKQAAEWARESGSPERYARLVLTRLL